jgi:hypothetical protein
MLLQSRALTRQHPAARSRRLLRRLLPHGIAAIAAITTFLVNDDGFAFAPSPVPKQINYASDGVTDGLLFTPGASGTGIVVDLGEPSGSRPVVDVAASRKIHLLRGVRTSPFILS